MSSKRFRAIDAIRVRLAEITKTNGFNTDAGDSIFLDEKVALGPDDPAAAIAIAVLNDDAGEQAVNVAGVMAIEIQAMSRIDALEPALATENLIEDVKRAVELEDRTLGGILLARGLDRGQTRIFPREEGSVTIGAGITYRLSFSEPWGKP